MRDSLRVSLTQLGARIRTWRSLFALAAVLLLGVLAWLGISYLRDHTKLLPQRETVVSYRESTPAEALAADIANLGSSICFYDVTYADGITGEALQMELWTHEGLTQVWQMAEVSNADPTDWPRHGTVALSLNEQFGESGESDRIHFGAALNMGLWNGTLNDVPYLAGGFGSNFLTEPTVVDREHGVVLTCYYLDPAGQGRWQVFPWLGAIEKPTAEQGQAFLLLRLLYKYE